MPASILFDLKPDKAAEAAAYLLHFKGGKMTRLELLKLLYLSDRKALSSQRRPIVGGHYVSMDHGPVLSEVYNLIKGCGGRGQDDWSRLVKNEDDDELMCVLVQNPKLSRLSRRELQILRDTFAEFGSMSVSELWNYVHALPEYEDPQGSSKPISQRRLLSLLGADDEELRAIEQDVKYRKRYDRVLGKARRGRQ